MDNSTVNSLMEKGFTFDGTENYTTELAFLSLDIGLQSFFATYQSMASSISSLADENDLDQEHRNQVYNRKYRQLYTETVIHLQHFAELVCKNFLRDIHPLLSVKIPSKDDKNTIFDKLSKNEKVDEDSILPDWRSSDTIEFSETLNRLNKLNRDKILPPELDFIAQHQYCLTKLNWLRNRIWHQGTYVLQYQAFDKFIAGGVLPYTIRFSTNAAVCTCCSFSVDNSIQNPQTYGFDIDDYWFIIG
ncbi:MAG: hypothetical protein EI684_17055 [Candidatus Viridilinea halotolerans]|uniref:Uncharacterized protein n=1 Tax=Candidatus Viridilinea halotolerans TaxID=2491704 RepID=A0A426TUF5_9CHLR|nr:MAG: hypothetical protein EI684_17055 [Candidatus Viridilinea halotolerans]